MPHLSMIGMRSLVHIRMGPRYENPDTVRVFARPESTSRDTDPAKSPRMIPELVVQAFDITTDQDPRNAFRCPDPVGENWWMVLGRLLIAGYAPLHSL